MDTRVCQSKTVLNQGLSRVAMLFSVKVTVVKPEELIAQIKADQKKEMVTQEPLPINIFTANEDAGKSTSGINGQFVFVQSLIDCLLRLTANKMDKKELISCFEKEYKDNRFELAKLREFEKSYAQDNALWWYTRDSFFYKTLNTALRKQDIHMMFLYRSYIVDINSQLKNYQCEHPVRVYRSQLISIDELNYLKENINQFVSINSFLSTSTDHEVAKYYTGDTTQPINMQRALFEIDADPKLVSTKPFADIANKSHFADESEVLFAFGSIFRLNSIDCGEDQVWTIKLFLGVENSHNLNSVLVNMKRQNGTGETNLWTLGKLLWNMGKLDLAEQYYKRLIRELSPNEPSLHSLYLDLGNIASQRGDYDESMQWHQKSLAIGQRTARSDSITTGKIISAMMSIRMFEF